MIDTNTVNYAILKINQTVGPVTTELYQYYAFQNLLGLLFSVGVFLLFMVTFIIFFKKFKVAYKKEIEKSWVDRDDEKYTLSAVISVISGVIMLVSSLFICTNLYNMHMLESYPRAYILQQTISNNAR